MGNLQGHILVVDDDPEMCRLLSDVLSDEGHRVETCMNGADALKRLSADIELVITDLQLKEMQGLDLMHGMKAIHPEISVMIITAFGTLSSAVEAMKQGAYDYIPKPLKMDELSLVVQKALRESALRREVVQLRKEIGRSYRFENMIGKSKAMQAIFDLVRRVSDAQTNILITGDSGTGKELVARAIHYNGPHRDKPFIPVNCAAIPETLLESEFFGHVEGAFTDAKADKRGLFEEADGGTILLDEISELPLSLQAKLLRVIQEKEVRRVGSAKLTPVDVRILAASNMDLTEAVEQKRFRQDLFYRLNVIHIHVPPLCQRREDIMPLAYHFLKKYKEETPRPIHGFSEAVMSLFLSYAWPGNVRELENAVERGIIMARREEIVPEDLPETLNGGLNRLSTLVEAVEGRFTLEALESAYIARILEQTAGAKAEAAHILGIDRKTLYRKLEHYKKNATSTKEAPPATD